MSDAQNDLSQINSLGRTFFGTDTHMIQYTSLYPNIWTKTYVRCWHTCLQTTNIISCPGNNEKRFLICRTVYIERIFG